MIQMMEKIRATIDFGALSPYLKQKEIKPPLIYDIIIQICQWSKRYKKKSTKMINAPIMVNDSGK